MNLCSRKSILKNFLLGFRFNSLEGLHTTRCLCEKNYYDVLNLKKDCSIKEVKDAYIDLAKKYHPDTNPHDSNNHLRFVEIQEAYSVLSTPSKRREYDIGSSSFPSHTHPNKRRHTDVNDDYDFHFNEEYKEFFYKSRQQSNGNPPAPVGLLRVTMLLLAFTALGGLVQYLFLKWLYRRNINEEMEKHQRATAAFYALKGEMDGRKEEYDLHKLRLAYFKEVGHGTVSSHFVPNIIRNEMRPDFRNQTFLNKGNQKSPQPLNSEVKESPTVNT